MKRYLMLWLMCAAITGVQIQYAGQENERERTAFNEGYAMVLNKQWQTAVEHLQTFINNHQESRYTDDAAYWKAYALKHIDKEKSAEAYRNFIDQYPGSRYIDDAVADLGALEQAQRSQPLHIELQQLLAQSSRLRAESSRAIAHQSRIIADISRQRAELSRLLIERTRLQKNLDDEINLRIESIQTLARMSPDEEIFNILRNIITDKNEDSSIRLVALNSLQYFKDFSINSLLLELIDDKSDEDIRFYAIQHVARNKELHNEQTFQTLRTIALDRNERERKRVMSLHALLDFDDYNINEILRDILTQKNDDTIRIAALYQLQRTESPYFHQLKELLKNIAIDGNESTIIRATALNTLERLNAAEWINILSHIVTYDHNRDVRHFAILSFQKTDETLSIHTLLELFESPELQNELTLGLILHSIASIGADESVNILARVAQTHENYEIRRYAIRMLGNIGGEKARGVLYEILTQ